MEASNWVGGSVAWQDVDHWLWAAGIHAIYWLVVAAIIVALIIIFRRTRNRAGTKDAMSLLAVRYARGEIDRAEHLDRKRDLQTCPRGH